MQTIAFPRGMLIVNGEPGHDGLFIWPSSYKMAPEPGIMVPASISPSTVRILPCPSCGAPNVFWSLHSQIPHSCVECMHGFTVVGVQIDSWDLIRHLLSPHNPWIRKRYRPVVPIYAGAPTYEEYDSVLESLVFQPALGSRTISAANSVWPDPRSTRSDPTAESA
jgi:hypothetical protein